jgi:hypothetical protein
LSGNRNLSFANYRHQSNELDAVRATIITTQDLALLQEAGVYQYRHPLTDAVAYESKLAEIEDQIKSMTRKEGGAVQSATTWTVNGSGAEGRAMLRDFSIHGFDALLVLTGSTASANL